MAFWNKPKATENVPEPEPPKESPSDDGFAALLTAFLGRENIGENEAWEVPAVAGAIGFIAGKIAALSINLYKRTDKEAVEEVKDDPRVRLLNGSTGDTLNSFEQRTALISDYFLHGRAYLYKETTGNTVKALRYVSASNVTEDYSVVDPIFRTRVLWVNGKAYHDCDFIRLTRNPNRNGYGRGILAQNPLLLSISHSLMSLEHLRNRTGGIKRGFFETENRLEGETLNVLKEKYNAMYSNKNENVMVLNSGLKFHESSNTALEMQMCENKLSNTTALGALFGVSWDVLTGGGGEGKQLINAMKNGVMPVIQAIEAALNNDLLLESEKCGYYFAADTRELLRGDLLERYQAYALGLDNSFLQVDEVRQNEDMKPLGLNFIKMKLSDTLFDPPSKEIYTPNTGRIATIGGGEKDGKQAVPDENRDT